MTQNLVKTFFIAIISCTLRPKYLIVQRCFDSTPFDVEFGDMHDDLKVYARSGCRVPLHGYAFSPGLTLHDPRVHGVHGLCVTC